MKRFVLFFAIAWLAQGALCVLPLGFAHAHAVSADPAGSHHHNSNPEPEPARGHHSQDDPSCAEHCASLSRALATQAPQPEPCGSLVTPLPPNLFLGTAIPSHRTAPVARGQPPPDLAHRNRTLRL